MEKKWLWSEVVLPVWDVRRSWLGWVMPRQFLKRMRNQVGSIVTESPTIKCRQRWLNKR